MSELEIIRHPRVGGISMFFNTMEYRTPHFHPEWELIWITEGELSVSSGQTEALCGTGELCLFSPRQIHEFRRRERGATFLCLQVAPQLLAYAYPDIYTLRLDAFRLRPFLREKQARELRMGMKRLMGEYLSGAPYFELRCAGDCAALFGELFALLPMRALSGDEIANADRRNERLSRFLDYVDKNYTEKIRLEDFARSEGCSVSYLSRFLKSNLNQSFQDYVNTMRFHCACRLIAEGGKRLIDVCEEAGFSDYRYFSQCFRKSCGMTPEQYRRERPQTNPIPAQRSLHSLERFYTREESLNLLQSL
jgi:AraC-like DNA-binding protein